MTDPQDWRDAALCRGNHLFVRPTEATRHELAVMTATCAACPSFMPCRDDMQQRGDFVGVRAGVVWTTPNGDAAHAEPRRLLEPRKCKWCHGSYTPAVGVTNSRYCSGPCRYEAGRHAARAASRAGSKLRETS